MHARIGIGVIKEHGPYSRVLVRLHMRIVAHRSLHRPLAILTKTCRGLPLYLKFKLYPSAQARTLQVSDYVLTVVSIERIVI